MTYSDNSVPIALTIAGSDSGGGAGIQADLKAFSANGVYGASVITALTAQNTRTVTAIADLEPAFIEAQLAAVFDDLDVVSVKIGMLSRPDVIGVVADALKTYRPQFVVLDPVMVAKSGDKLLSDDAIASLTDALLPLADIVTPNLPEAGVLTSAAPPTDIDGMKTTGAALIDLGAKAVLMKGGHMTGDTLTDILVAPDRVTMFEGQRIATKNTHGTGCTLSSAIAAHLAHGKPLADAVAAARTYLTTAIEAADQLHVGSGHGPVHHFAALWNSHTGVKSAPGEGW